MGKVTTRTRRVLPGVIARCLAAALVLGPLASCSPSDSTSTIDTVLVIAARANMPALVDAQGQPVGGALASEVTRLSEAEGTLTIVRDDGSPKTTSATLTIDKTSSTTRDDSAAANRDTMAGELRLARATVGEADPVTALDEAVRATSAGQGIDMFDNGLSTTGTMLMQTGLLTQSGDMKKLAAQLKQQRVLGSLKGIHVRWYGLGEVAAPQGRVPEWALAQLKTLYTTLITDAGGTVEFLPLAAASGNGVTTPKVSVVPFVVQTVSANPSKAASPPISRVLDETQLAFVADSVEFADPSAAAATLKTVAIQLSSGDYPTVWVYGCTARPKGATDAGLKAFGLKRAQRVVSVLIKQGARATLRAASLGWACPGYVNDRDANGDLVTDLATRNRRVIITSQQLQPVK